MGMVQYNIIELVSLGFTWNLGAKEKLIVGSKRM